MDRLASAGRPASGASDTADAILDVVRDEFGEDRSREPMSAVVIDASVVLRWLLVDEADRVQALAVRDRIQAGQFEPRQPPHFPLDVASALVVAERNGRIRSSAVGPLMRSLEAFRLELMDPGDFAAAAAEAALELGLRVPDAGYIVSARRSGGTLITADRRLFDVALNSGTAAAFLAEVTT